MSAPKLRRWIDLLAALLRRNYAVSLEELTRDVPAYAAARNKTALRRMFERDKDELRAFGIPISTTATEDQEESGYRLDRKQFYLPYLLLAQESGRSRPRRVDRHGYRALADLTFEPDELGAVVHAAERVMRIGDPGLAGVAQSAMRKLAFDLPIGVGAAAPPAEALKLEERILPPPLTPAAAPPRFDVAELRVVRYEARRPPADVFAALDDALRRRKRVKIEYRGIASGAVTTRDVAPYGLFFLGHHWYLAARDAGAETGPVKNFRVSRILDAAVNPRNENSADYEIPAGFRLRDHARSRQAWELGDGTVLDALVEFRGGSGATLAARRLGEAVPGAPERRRFSVRRTDAFARWLLSFGGEVVPLEPAELVGEWAALARRTREVYGRPA
jgi:proteasome accessory factor B